MITIGKCPFIALQCNWKLANVKKDVVYLSNKIKYQKNESFRVGFKHTSPYSPPTLLFITMNLNKAGLKAAAVTFSFNGSDAKRIEMDNKTSSGEADENGALQLFTAPVEGNFNRYNPPTSFNFNFTVYLTGIVEDFQVNHMDNLMGKQLWSALSHQDKTDFKLMTKDGQGFPVHKFILAARSPFFANLFSETRHHQTTSYPLDNCSQDQMNQFIKFMYTGEFHGSVSDELLQLAVKYQVKTLEKICQEASQDVSVDKMASIAMHLEPGTHELCGVEDSKIDLSDLEIKHEENIAIIKVTWKVDRWTKENEGTIEKSTATSQAFGNGGVKPSSSYLNFATDTKKR